MSPRNQFIWTSSLQEFFDHVKKAVFYSNPCACWPQLPHSILHGCITSVWYWICIPFDKWKKVASRPVQLTFSYWRWKSLYHCGALYTQHPSGERGLCLHHARLRQMLCTLYSGLKHPGHKLILSIEPMWYVNIQWVFEGICSWMDKVGWRMQS